MNTKKYISCFIAFLAAAVISCGEDIQGPGLYGSVDLTGAGTVSGPVFLIISTTEDLAAIREDPVNSVKSIITLDVNNNFSFNADDAGVSEGDDIYLVAFVDNDYSGGVPIPTPGDWLGFYINQSTWQRSWAIASGSNEIPPIRVNREVFDFYASVTGTLSDPGAGDVILIACTGSMDSLDFSAIDLDQIIAFSKITKPEGPCDYSMDIFPYGKDVPITGAYIFALLDQNNNGIPDAGDRIGYFSGTGSGIPGQTTIHTGENSGTDIDTFMDIPEPSGYNISVSGSFSPPSGYSASSTPMYIIVAETEDPVLFLEDPLSYVRNFCKVTPGETSFDIDLSGTELEPGNKVMVVALWDLDNTGGFMDPTAGDKIGYYQNTDVNSFAYTITLAEGENYVTHQASGDWKFEINKILYDYNTSVRFKLDSYRPDGVLLEEGHDLIAIAVFNEGVNDGVFEDYMINDMNYVLGMETVPYVNDTENIYEFNILNAIDERITDTSSMDIYVYVIYDRDGNGMPSTGDDIAAYWKNIIIIGDIPKIWTLQSDSVNLLSDPDSAMLLNQTY